MPISGLAITLSDESSAETAVEALRSHPAVTLGQRDGLRLPIVVETATSEEDRDVWDWIQNMPGVLFVDVACVYFDDEQDADHQRTVLAEGSQES